LGKLLDFAANLADWVIARAYQRFLGYNIFIPPARAPAGDDASARFVRVLGETAKFTLCMYKAAFAMYNSA
jgi:hypothetical protein